MASGPASHPSRRSAILAALLVGPQAAAGCGYHLGWKAAPAVSSIAVPIFDNQTFPLRRDVEYDLTRAVRRQIQERSDLRLLDQDRADIVVYGKIIEFSERVITEGVQDEKLESNLRVIVELRVEDYVNLRTSTTRVRDVEPFSVDRGESIDLARQRAIDNLAEKILLAIETW